MSANAAIRALKDQGVSVGRRQDALAEARGIIANKGQLPSVGTAAVAASRGKAESGRVGGRASSFIRGSKTAKTLPKEQRRALTGVIRKQEKRVREERKAEGEARQAAIDSLIGERDRALQGTKGQSRRNIRYEFWLAMQQLYADEEYEDLLPEDLVSPEDMENLNEIYSSPTMDDPDTRAAAVGELYDFLHGFTDEDVD